MISLVGPCVLPCLLRMCYILDVNGQQQNTQEDLVLASLALFFGGKLFFTSSSRRDVVSEIEATTKVPIVTTPRVQHLHNENHLEQKVHQSFSDFDDSLKCLHTVDGQNPTSNLICHWLYISYIISMSSSVSISFARLKLIPVKGMNCPSQCSFLPWAGKSYQPCGMVILLMAEILHQLIW